MTESMSKDFYTIRHLERDVHGIAIRAPGGFRLYWPDRDAPIDTLDLTAACAEITSLPGHEF